MTEQENLNKHITMNNQLQILKKVHFLGIFFHLRLSYKFTKII